MIKRFFILSTVFFLLIFAHTAQADIIWEPRGPRIAASNDSYIQNLDDFYLRRWKECKYLPQQKQSFYANGNGGSVSVKDDPFSEEEITVIKNSDTCLIICTIECFLEGKAETWGWARDYDGWIPMDQLVPYDK